MKKYITARVALSTESFMKEAGAGMPPSDAILVKRVALSTRRKVELLESQ